MSGLNELSNAMADLAEAVGQSTVRVEARRRMPATGIAWSDDGLVVTSNHVVRRDENISVGLPDGARTAATLVGRDPGSDLALLRVEGAELTAPAWLDAADLRVGYFALALGRPGQTVQATLGVVSAVGASWRTAGGGVIDRYLQTDVLMYPGFSGGPLAVATEQGVAVAGLNTSALAHGASLAVPTETMRRVVGTLLEHGHMPRGYLGVGLQPVRLNTAMQEELDQESGVMLVSVEEGGPAADAGLLQGDILVALGGDRVRHVDDLQAALGGDRVGREVLARIVRGGALQEVAVTVGRKAK